LRDYCVIAKTRSVTLWTVAAATSEEVWLATTASEARVTKIVPRTIKAGLFLLAHNFKVLVVVAEATSLGVVVSVAAPFLVTAIFTSAFTTSSTFGLLASGGRRHPHSREVVVHARVLHIIGLRIVGNQTCLTCEDRLARLLRLLCRSAVLGLTSPRGGTDRKDHGAVGLRLLGRIRVIAGGLV